jgi:predicted PurR-regulated permease PerM
LFSFVPYVGVVFGAGPALLLAGVDGASAAITMAAVVLALQLGHMFAGRSLCKRTVYVGPAAVLIAVVLGYTAYGIGGALFGLVLAVVLSALAEVFGTDDTRDPEELEALSVQ